MRQRGGKGWLAGGAGVGLVLAGCLGPRPELVAPPAPEPVSESASPEGSEPAGLRPYELEWDPRVEAYDPRVDFEFVLGWEAVAEPGREAVFTRSAERPLWGRYAGKLTFFGGVVDICPPEPLEIRDRIDSLQLWVHGPPGVAAENRPQVALVLEGADGRRQEVWLGQVDWEGWNLLHRRLPTERVASFAPPLRLAAIRWMTGGSADPATYYLDSLALYTERRTTLPAPLCPPPADIAAAEPPPCELSEVGRGQFEMRCGETPGGLVYAVDAASLGEGVAVWWDGAYRGHWLRGMEIVPSGRLGGPYQVARVEKGEVYIEYNNGVVCILRARGATLSIEVEGRGEEHRGFRLARGPEGDGWQGIEVPGLTTGPGLPVDIGWTDRGVSNLPPLFVCTRFDWDRSAASGFAGLEALYRPASDGAVHHVAETLELTVAPRLEDVLPRASAPVGRYRDALANRVWVDSDGPADYAVALAETERLAGLGIRAVAQGHLPACWRDHQESCTLRDRAAPGKGGDEALRQFLAHQRDLGWITGLWVDYLQVHPLNAHWSADVLQRTPELDWVPAMPGQFRVKPAQAAVFQADLAPRIRDRFAPSLSYVGDMASAPPGTHTDYDTGAPGAGRFDAAYHCISHLLRTEADVLSGPVVGDGGAEALYAGQYDGYLVRDPDYPLQILPVFVLGSLHSRAVRFGAGDQLVLPPPAGLDPAGLDRRLDRYLAHQIAFGAAGRLAPPGLGPARECRSYYMMTFLQPRYLALSPERISYWDGSAYLNASQAIVSGALDHGRLYVRYGPETELWVNGAETADWKVRVGADTWTLPPYGWVAAGPDFFELSARLDGHRIDYVSSGLDRYLDGRGTLARFRELASSGPLALRITLQEDGFQLTFSDLAHTGHFGFALPEANGQAPLPVTHYAASGLSTGHSQAQFRDGMFWVDGDAHRYVIDVPAPSLPPTD